MSTHGNSMASKAMDEAVELAIEERSPYPERSAFIDADTPDTAREIFSAASEGYAVVLVADDGKKLILHPEQVAAARTPTAKRLV